MKLSPAKTKPMQLPPEEEPSARDDSDGIDLDRFRPYLLMLARLQFDEVLQAKLDASDVVQQTMLEAHQALADFRGTSDREKAAWLRRILARNLADEMRKFQRGKRNVNLEASLQSSLNESTVCLENWLAHEDASPSECAIANEQLVDLAAALMKLPEDQRRAVELHHLQGRPSAAVAEQLGRTEVSVAGLLRRGLKRLRELMRESKEKSVNHDLPIRPA
jgi:RNA polymerase sigma-70 factor, ECF subfamily